MWKRILQINVDNLYSKGYNVNSKDISKNRVTNLKLSSVWDCMNSRRDSSIKQYFYCIYSKLYIVLCISLIKRNIS